MNISKKDRLVVKKRAGKAKIILHVLFSSRACKSEFFGRIKPEEKAKSPAKL